MKEQLHICPLCGRAYDEPPALSRVDNQTEICPRCGMMEALAAMPRRETPQERTRRAVYATGNRWAIENFEATHHYDNILVKSSVTVSQNISVTVTTDTADTDEAVENRVKAILTELLAVRRSRKLNELTLSDINHAIRSGYSGATNAAVSEPEADVKLGKDKVITLGDVSVTVERE